tara:strand:- start:253 stop:420 length:168 start_codon:yes stop_codon:yes gene_type:complete
LTSNDNSGEKKASTSAKEYLRNSSKLSPPAITRRAVIAKESKIIFNIATFYAKKQ